MYISGLNFHIDRHTYRYTIVQDKKRKHKKSQIDRVKKIQYYIQTRERENINIKHLILARLDLID